MRKDKKRKTMQNTLTSIDSVLAALSAYPNLEDALLDRAQQELNKYMGKFFPTQLDFSKEILEHLVGTDVLIDIVSGFLTVGLPPVEIAIKTALLANMQNLGTNCDIDPFIYEKAIKEGIMFDLRQIDLYDKLTVSPLDEKIGQYFYFGTKNCESSHDVLMSAINPNEYDDEEKNSLERGWNNSVAHYFDGKRKRDFDCLLWYMKNKGITRQVWGKRTTKSEDIFNGGDNIQEWVDAKGDDKTSYYEINNSTLNVYKKGSKTHETGVGKVEQIKTDTIYIHKEGKITYEYKFGNSSITKLNRKKYYYVETSAKAYTILYFNNTEWKNEKVTEVKKYNTINDIPDNEYNNLKEGDYIVLGTDLHYITKVNQTTKGTTKSISTKIGIDITNEIKQDTTLFVDYDEVVGDKTKGELIKDGDENVTSTFSGKIEGYSNKGQKIWKKNKVKKDTKTNVDGYECYYGTSIEDIIIPPTTNDNDLMVSIKQAQEEDTKYTKEFGLLTLDYSPRTGNLLQSDGKPMHQQTPYDNVLHVFFGNVKELPSSERNQAEAVWENTSNVNNIARKLYKKIQKLLKEHKNAFDDFIYARDNSLPMYLSDPSKMITFYEVMNSYKDMLDGNDFVIKDTLPTDYDIEKINNLDTIVSEALTTLDRFNNELYGVNVLGLNEWFKVDETLNLINTLNDKLKIGENYYSISAYCDRIGQIMDISESDVYLKSRDVEYPEAKQNYYLRRTLFEFNADYINSLQLFDPKVLAAQLVTSMFGGFAVSTMIGATASWKTELIRDIVKDMVEKEIAAEDFTVSDCFFTFTNDAYNGMLRAADLRQAGLYSQHGEENGNNRIDPVKLLEGLNDFDNSADQAGQTEVIKGAITKATGEVCKDSYKENSHLSINSNFGIQKSFIQTLMINLCTQMVMAVLSPKVYLLILINLELFGLSTNFSLKAFIERFEALIRSIVRSIVNQFMQYLTQKIMEIIEELTQKLIKKLTLEQVEMYARLIKQILMHLRMLFRRGGTLGWSQDQIEFADIKESAETNTEPVNEC